MNQLAPQRRLRWYAVRCETARHVPKVAAEAERLGIPAFVPKAYREEKRGKWIVAVEDGLLFPPYLFIAMRAPGPWKSPGSILWGQVYDVSGVVKVMGNYDGAGVYRPQPVPYKEMRRIRTKHAAGERKLQEVRFVKDQKVKITGGTWEGFEGIFDMPVKDRVKVLLSLFGRETPVEIEENNVRAA